MSQTPPLSCWPLVVLLVALGGCTGSSQSTGANDGDSPNTITQEEIQEIGVSSSAHNLVRRLEPEWLRKRGRSSIQNPGDVRVYVDGTSQGGPETLRGIDVINVKSIKFLEPDEATMRYGGGHDNGVILVKTKGRGGQ